jgi:hypothetical protein
MTKLGDPIPKEIADIRSHLADFFDKEKISLVDANDKITGRDFLLKIWHIILGVPLGIAIITEDISCKTLANIYYELGLMQAYGKETLVIKTERAEIPSDFVRTEYIEFPSDFKRKFKKYFKTFSNLPEYYRKMSDQVENNPLLSIDYLKRAWLISGEDTFRQKAKEIYHKEIYHEAAIEGRAKNSVEMLLVDFCTT